MNLYKQNLHSMVRLPTTTLNSTIVNQLKKILKEIALPCCHCLFLQGTLRICIEPETLKNSVLD